MSGACALQTNIEGFPHNLVALVAHENADFVLVACLAFLSRKLKMQKK